MIIKKSDYTMISQSMKNSRATVKNFMSQKLHLKLASLRDYE